jgi:hypothetical protein
MRSCFYHLVGGISSDDVVCSLQFVISAAAVVGQHHCTLVVSCMTCQAVEWGRQHGLHSMDTSCGVHVEWLRVGGGPCTHTGASRPAPSGPHLGQAIASGFHKSALLGIVAFGQQFVPDFLDDLAWRKVARGISVPAVSWGSAPCPLLLTSAG